jgi:hypothetical protein
LQTRNIVTIWQHIHATLGSRQNVGIFVHFPPQRERFALSADAEIQKCTGGLGNALEHEIVKTGLDSERKHQTAGKILPVSLAGIFTVAKRRYLAGNSAYICLHDNLCSLPLGLSGKAFRSAARKTQYVRKIVPLCRMALQYRVSIGYRPGSLREVR